jgi:class 3 adenylate cyclase
MYAAIWMMFAPVGAALALGTRSVLAMLVGFVLSVLLVAWLEPYSISIAPEISPAVRVRFNVSSLVSLGLILTAAALVLLRQVDRYRAQSETLLHNILPQSIAARLKGGAPTIADRFEQVTILFADIENFTSMSANADPADIVNLLNNVYSDFDELASKYGLEKIKTIGDCYMVAAGVPVPRADHIDCIISFAQDMLAAVRRHTDLQGAPMNLRIGINTGPVVAGVIGRQKFSYDLWCDTVNVASRMEQGGAPNRIQVTQAVKDRMDGRYTFEERAPIPIKGKGLMVTYFLMDE